MQYSADLVGRDRAGGYALFYVDTERVDYPWTRTTRTLVKKKFTQSLYPELGSWVWTAWIDTQNESLYISPRETLRWVDAIDANLQEPFNL